MKAVIVFALFTIAFAKNLAAPPTPSWPNAFSSSIWAKDNQGDESHFRWFYDFSQQKERIDGMQFFLNEVYFTSTIIDWDEETIYNIIFHDDAVFCITNTTVGQMLNPSFSGLSYAGQSMIFFETVNWFYQQISKNQMLQVWTSAQTNELVRVDFTDLGTQFDAIYTFMELDIAAQDPALFAIDPAIDSICFSP